MGNGTLNIIIGIAIGAFAVNYYYKRKSKQDIEDIKYNMHNYLAFAFEADDYNIQRVVNQLSKPQNAKRW